MEILGRITGMVRAGAYSLREDTQLFCSVHFARMVSALTPKFE